MEYKDNKLINVDFSKEDKDYFIIFRTPENVLKRIMRVDKLELKRVSPDSLSLTIEHHNGRRLIYHYVNDNITLLDDLDIGIE